MADFCLTPEATEDFRKALKSRDLDLVKLLGKDVSTEDRAAAFRPYTGDAAEQVAHLFEQKLVLKNRVQGIKNFANKVGEMGRYSPEGKAALKNAAKEYEAAQQKRIFSPGEHESFLNSLADKATGVHIDKDVAQRVFELSSEAQRLKDVNPKMSGVSDEYLQARNALNAYVAVQKNTSPLKSIGRNLITIGRNNLLLGLSTPVKTTIAQTINSAMDFVSRRLGAQALGGEASELASAANKEAWQTYVKTGVNTASLENLGDIGLNKLGERLNFRDVAGSNTPGALGTAERAVGKVAQLSNKVAIDWEHNITFTKFYQKTFFDAANIMATKVAEQAGKDAKDIFADAVRIEPETPEGTIVRSAAQEQAARITSTNPTWVSNIAMGIKNALNRAVPGLPLGDLLIPMAKIPSTVIANAIENAGPGIPLGIRDIVQGRTAMASTDMATRIQGMVQQARGYQRLTRTVGVLGAAAWFASGLDNKDFRTDKWGNHYVHIAGLWVNLEYVAAMSPALAGMMWVKSKAKPGEGIADTVSHYIAGGLQELKRAPAVDELTGLVEAVTESDYSKGIVKYFKDAIASRGVPAFIRNAQRPGNIFERELTGAHGVETDQEVKQDELNAARRRALSRQGVNP